MADIDTLESLAGLLPEKHREKFFKIASKFSTVPEDDDHLQMLEAVGYMMLVIDEVPARIAEILKDSQQRLGNEESTQLRTEIVAALTDSLDTPSYKDLREAVASIRDQDIRFRRQIDALYKSLGEARDAAKPAGRFLTGMWTGLVGGSIVACCMAALLLTLPEFDGVLDRKSTSKTEAAWRALHQQGMLNYIEMALPEFGGEFGVFSIKGDVQGAYMDGNQGVVAVRLKDRIN